MKRQTILVTGGAGFIGSHLCEKLLTKGYQVICFDNLSAGQKKNISHLKDLVFVKGDANIFSDLEKIFKSQKLFAVFHYAAMVGVKRTLENPVAVLDDINSTRHVLNLALKFGKPKIIFASSSEVYGEPVEIPEIEKGHVNAKMPYSVVKLYCEKLLEAYWQEYQLPICALRFFNVYGPRQESSDYGFVVGIFIKRALKGLPPQIYGDGTQTRDFVFINDNVEASIRALESSAVNGEVINIGTGRPTTILDLAEEIAAVCSPEKEIKPEFLAKRDDVRHRFPDIGKMRCLLNFRPRYSLREGLAETIRWYQKNEK